MSGIAEVLATQGYRISGSDLHASKVTARLARLGVTVAIGHAAANVADADAVVVSTAVANDNPELAAARDRGIPIVPRALMLAELMRLKQGIAIAGITNIDADHMENYGHDFERLKRAFVDFAQRLPFYGVAVLCIDDPTIREIMPAITKTIVTYGLTPDARIHADGVTNVEGRMRFVAHSAGAPDLPVELNLPGEHNVRNALAAIAVGREVGVRDHAIAGALAEFHGVDRRFQRYGDLACDGGAYTVIDDYGHHPIEMAATIAA